MPGQYTATLYYNDQALSSQSSDDDNQLMISLLDMLETTTVDAHGVIVDNRQGGKVVKRVSKSVPEIGRAHV